MSQSIFSPEVKASWGGAGKFLRNLPLCRAPENVSVETRRHAPERRVDGDGRTASGANRQGCKLLQAAGKLASLRVGSQTNRQGGNGRAGRHFGRQVRAVARISCALAGEGVLSKASGQGRGQVYKGSPGRAQTTGQRRCVVGLVVDRAGGDSWNEKRNRFRKARADARSGMRLARGRMQADKKWVRKICCSPSRSRWQ